MGCVFVKDGVEFTKIAPGGFRILGAIEGAAFSICDLTITSACDGEHSGPNDPHKRGEAYDVRSHDLDQDIKYEVLEFFQAWLGKDEFYAFLEDANTANEHFHIQVKKGTIFTGEDLPQ